MSSQPSEETEWFTETLPTTINEVTLEPAAPLVPMLIVLNGKDKGKRFPLEKRESVFGRDPEGELFIKDSQISRKHGRVHILDDKVELEDLNSTNGIFVDGTAIERCTISSNSRIQVGNTLLKLAYKDPSELEMEEELYKAATTDALTGIMNRRAFMEAAQQDLSYAHRNQQGISLLMVDADHFKKVNDDYGHPVGDLVLKTIAQFLNQTIREEDRLGRYGGEEFIMLLRGKKGDHAAEFAERLRKGVADQKIPVEEDSISITISIGFCSGSGEELIDLENLISKADTALYKAKSLGRNQIVEFTPQ